MQVCTVGICISVDVRVGVCVSTNQQVPPPPGPRRAGSVALRVFGGAVQMRDRVGKAAASHQDLLHSNQVPVQPKRSTSYFKSASNKHK